MRSVAPTLLLLLAALARPVTVHAQQPAAAGPVGDERARVRLEKIRKRTSGGCAELRAGEELPLPLA